MALKSSLPVADSTAEIFAALGDKTRLKLVRRLCHAGPLSITELSEGMEQSRQAITKHLRVMEDSGLLTSSKTGRKQIFELDQKRFEIAKNYLDLVSNRWDSAIDRLKRHLGED